MSPSNLDSMERTALKVQIERAEKQVRVAQCDLTAKLSAHGTPPGDNVMASPDLRETLERLTIAHQELTRLRQRPQ